MKTMLTAGAALLIAGLAGSPAYALGPKASSETMILPENAPAASHAPGVAATATSAAPQYVWTEGYDPHGKWHGHWVLVR